MGCFFLQFRTTQIMLQSVGNSQLRENSTRLQQLLGVEEGPNVDAHQVFQLARFTSENRFREHLFKPLTLVHISGQRQHQFYCQFRVCEVFDQPIIDKRTVFEFGVRVDTVLKQFRWVQTTM